MMGGSGGPGREWGSSCPGWHDACCAPGCLACGACGPGKGRAISSCCCWLLGCTLPGGAPCEDRRPVMPESVRNNIINDGGAGSLVVENLQRREPISSRQGGRRGGTGNKGIPNFH